MNVQLTILATDRLDHTFQLVFEVDPTGITFSCKSGQPYVSTSSESTINELAFALQTVLTIHQRNQGTKPS